MALLVLTLGALAAAEHHFFEEEEAVSLLQLTAQKRGFVEQETGLGADTDSGAAWGGKPFFICESVKSGYMSHCPTINDPDVVEWAAKATSVRDCGIVANHTGADTFNFENEGQKCTPLKCDKVDVKAGPPTGVHMHKNVSIYSMFCGLTWVNGHFTSHVCGEGIPLYYGYHKFLKPPMKACNQTLNFSSLVSNNLHSGGPMIFSNVVPGVDVSIQADHFQAPQKDRTGAFRGFAVLNLLTGSNTTFTFTFHKAGTFQRVKVDHFIVTLAELSTSRECYNKMYVTATDYSGYYLQKNPQLVVKGSGGNETHPPSVTFKSAHLERGTPGRPRNGTIGKKLHKEMSASIYYRGTDSFKLKTEGVDAKWRGGAILRLGGQAMTTCNKQPECTSGVECIVG